MKKIIVFPSIFILIALISASNAQSADKGKIRIAVMDFDNESGWWGWKLGHAATDMLITELVKTKQFSVIEREKLELVLKEQNLAQSGAVTPQTAAKIGKILGVQAIVTGSVSQFGEADAHLDVGWKFGVKGKSYKATVDARLIDTTTAEILMAESASSTGITGGIRVKDISAGSEYNEQVAQKAMRGAIEKIAAKISETMKGYSPSDLGSGTAPGFKIAKVEGTKIWVNAGKNSGIKVGDVFSVYAKGEEIIDPDTGQSLGAEEEKIGTIVIIEVKDKLSIAEVKEGSGFEVGNVLKK